eukprot:6213985-Pleurochrysis_carterae.AAC.3
MQVRLRLRRNQEFTDIGDVAKLAHFSSGHRMNLHTCDVAYIIVNKDLASSFASRCAKALAFVAFCTLRKNLRFSAT